MTTLEAVETTAQRAAKAKLKTILKTLVTDIKRGRRRNDYLAELQDLLHEAMLIARAAGRDHVLRDIGFIELADPPGFLTTLFQELGAQVAAFVSELVAEGTPGKTGGSLVREKMGELGMSPIASHTADTMFKTFTQWSWNAGEWDAYQDPDVQDILWGYRYSTVGDYRVRPDHAALEGMQYPKDHDVWLTYWPPNGWNCRCKAIPILDSGEIVLPSYFPTLEPMFSLNPAIAA